MRWFAWLRERWRMLRDPALAARDESITLDVPVAVAVERLRRAVRPRGWLSAWLLRQNALYGSASRNHVEIFFSSGAYDAEGQLVTSVMGRFVSDPRGARLIGDYGSPRHIAPEHHVVVILLFGIFSWWVSDSIAARLLFGGVTLAGLASLFANAPRLGERLDGDMFLLRERLRRELRGES